MAFPGRAPGNLSKIVFDKYDKDKSGQITHTEFHLICYEMGDFMPKNDADLLFSQIDKDNSGHIDYEEFSSWWKSSRETRFKRLTEQESAKLNQFAVHFMSFDHDGSGALDHKEFAQLHSSLTSGGWKLPDAATLLKQLDLDNDGHVSFNEYVNHLMQVGALKAEYAE
eukprot:Colp12_sorted_trinity150504_noHs@21389